MTKLPCEANRPNRRPTKECTYPDQFWQPGVFTFTKSGHPDSNRKSRFSKPLPLPGLAMPAFVIKPLVLQARGLAYP